MQTIVIFWLSHLCYIWVLTFCQVLALFKQQKAHLDRSMDDNNNLFSSTVASPEDCGRAKTSSSTT